jgi:hypothetical protein
LTIILKHSDSKRRFLAACVLLLFSFCVTPKRVLHDVLANHRDVQTSPLLPVEQVSASGFHCQIDDLVVVAPFLPDMQTMVTGTASSDPVIFSEPVNVYSPVHLAATDSRGPPAFFCA